MTSESSEQRPEVVYKFCDINKDMVEAWKEHFKEYMPDKIKVYKGDIFKDGPAADAIVSPANSFGFMDGGIDMAYSRHFGWQMQDRLQKVIREEYDGELLVGQAAIITTLEHHNRNSVDWSKYNEGQPIKYLISAPTMRVPMDVADTANAYLAFRAIILLVQKFNKEHVDEPIRSVLCPGLGTAVGFMPKKRCAFQMKRAYETFYLRKDVDILYPGNLAVPVVHHFDMAQFGSQDLEGPPKDKSVIRVSNKGTKILQTKYEVKEDQGKKGQGQGHEGQRSGEEQDKSPNVAEGQTERQRQEQVSENGKENTKEESSQQKDVKQTD